MLTDSGCLFKPLHKSLQSKLSDSISSMAKVTEVSLCISLERYKNLVHLGWLHNALEIASNYTWKHQIGTPLIHAWLNFLYKAWLCKNPGFFPSLQENCQVNMLLLGLQPLLVWVAALGQPNPLSCTQGVTVHSKAENSSSHCYTTARTQVPILDRSFSCSYPTASLLQHVTFISSGHYASEFLSARSRLLFSESFSFPLGNLKK